MTSIKVSPGQNITDEILSFITSADTKTLHFGPGIKAMTNTASTNNDNIYPQKFIALLSGTLCFFRPNKFWIECNGKHNYIPSMGDYVIGSVSAKLAESFRIDFGAHLTAALSVLAFEGASKRNKPNIALGALVFAKVSLAHPDLEPELTCVDTATGYSDGLGELKDGMTITASLPYCQKLSMANSYVLGLLKGLACDIAVGANGIVWINSPSVKQTILIAKYIKEVEELEIDGKKQKEIQTRCKQLKRQLKEP